MVIFLHRIHRFLSAKVGVMIQISQLDPPGDGILPKAGNIRKVILLRPAGQQPHCFHRVVKQCGADFSLRLHPFRQMQRMDHIWQTVLIQRQLHCLVQPAVHQLIRRRIRVEPDLTDRFLQAVISPGMLLNDAVDHLSQHTGAGPGHEMSVSQGGITNSHFIYPNISVAQRLFLRIPSSRRVPPA